MNHPSKASPRRMVQLVALMAWALHLTACSDEGTALPLATGEDDDVVPTYAADIQSIWNVHCGPICHGTVGVGGLDLQPEASYEALVGFESPNYGADRIAPFDPDASVLFQKVTDSGVYGPAMPATGPRLTDAQIATIRQWILAGAPND